MQGFQKQTLKGGPKVGGLPGRYGVMSGVWGVLQERDTGLWEGTQQASYQGKQF